MVSTLYRSYSVEKIWLSLILKGIRCSQLAVAQRSRFEKVSLGFLTEEKTMGGIHARFYPKGDQFIITRGLQCGVELVTLLQQYLWTPIDEMETREFILV